MFTREGRASAAAGPRGQRRTLLAWRLAVLALVVAYFFLPYDVQSWIPVWLPFGAAVALEVSFFVGGVLEGNRDAGHRVAGPDRGPQPHDLAELGGDSWREAYSVEHAGERVYVPAAGLTEDEIHERLEAYLADPEAAEAAWSSPPPEPDETSAPRRQLARAVEALVVLAVVGGILFYASRPHGWDAVSTADRARAEALFSREASAIAGHPARVGCDSSGEHVGVVQEADGLAEVGGARAYLTPSLCDALYQLSAKHRVQSFPRTGRAIAVLAHEAWHLRGVRDEGLANCFAFQSGVQVGVHLGLSEDRARAMMRQQLATNATDSAGDARYLVPPGCQDGGEHDLHPSSSAFP